MHDLWKEIFEQNRTKDILTRISDSRRVPHAFLFYGPSGVGKFFTAVNFAKFLSAQNSGDDSIRKRISALQEPVVKYIFPLPRGKSESSDDSPFDKLSKDVLDSINDEIQKKISNPYYRISVDKANIIKINSIRDLKKFINISYEELSRRFIIIEDAHLMNDEAQNALLKSLEEPPPGIIFILLTSQKERLLPTIQSRCWQIYFEPLSSKAVAGILEKYFGIEKKLAGKVSVFAGGSVTAAMDLLDNDFENMLEKAVVVLRYSLAKRYNSAYKEIKDLVDGSSPKNFKLLIMLINIWLTDVVKNKFGIQENYFEDYKDTIEKFNQRFASVDVDKSFAAIDRLSDLQDRNVNLNILALNLIFEITSMAIRK